MTGIACVVALLAIAALAVCASAASAEQSPVKYISNFTGPTDIAGIKVTGARAQWSKGTEDGALIEGTAFEPTAVESGAMHMALLPGKGFTTVELSSTNGLPSDWSGYDRFVMHFENGSEFMINLVLTVADESGGEFVADNLWIFRSRNRIDVPLAEFRDGEGRAIDLTRVRRMKLEIRSAEKFERDLWLYRFRLERAAAPVVEPSKRRMLLDFTPLGAPIVPGAKVVHEKTAYVPWRGYGWTEGTPALRSVFFKKPEGLTGDWVWADLGDAQATLRVDLPDGKYRARFYGGNYNEKVIAVKSFALAVNGSVVARRAVDPESYYTTDGHFFGLDLWYEAGEDPYDKYVRPFYQTYDFDFEAKGGKAEFAWTETLAAFGLLIAPAEGDEFAAAAQAVEKARREQLAAAVTMPVAPSEPLEADEVESERGFVLWARPWQKAVAIHDRPSPTEREPKVLRFKAARGERSHAAFTVTPLKDLGTLSVEVTGLAGDHGGRVGGKAFDVRVVKYMWQGWPARVEPGFLYPTKEVPAAADVNRTFWLTLTVPRDAEAGMYRGTLRVKSAGGGQISLPIELQVRPFELLEDHNVSYAWWRTSDYNMNYLLRYFLPEKLDYLRRLLDAEFANMKAHGCTAVYFSPPIIKGVDGEKVILDFFLLEEEANAALKHGLCDKARPGMVFTLPDVARYLMKETRYGDYLEPEDISAELPLSEQVEEFSDLFNARFVDAVRQIHEFFEKKGLNVLIYPVDEPRERNTNRWNRNLADTIRYCKLIREHVPGARIYVDPMRDENSGVDYLPICDYVDVIGTHPWDQSARTVKRAGNEALPVLWYFNAIVWDRYDFGFQVAAADARGFWQWHYQWDWIPFQPFHPGFKWGVTLPGPDGPYDRLNYEMVAQAIDDYRYIATLERRLGIAKDQEVAENAIAAAEETLSLFYDNAPHYPTREDYSGRPRSERTGRNTIAGKSLDQWRDILSGRIEDLEDAMEPL